MRFNRSTLNGGASGIALLVSLIGTSALADTALPVGGTVVSGSAQIGAASGSGVTINQSSANAIINWNSFNVGAGKTVTFNQPDPNSATLNRVTGNTASTIAGQITANGSVYLINPNGIQITKSGAVTVGRGFVASTLDIADADFLAGKGAFSGIGGAVDNDGTITTQTGGYVGLLGGSVSNTGLILAPAGHVVIGAGVTATLDVNGGNFLQVALPSGSAIAGDGKAAALTGAQARNAVRNIVNLPDDINARSVAGQNGDITLGGTIDVDSVNGNAGNVLVLGNNLVANGTLTARALGATGNGGLIETSGNSVNFTGVHVDTSAAHGSSGTWLVDPFDLTVDASAASTIAGNLASTNVVLQTTNTGTSGPGTTSSGSGDITIASAINWSSANRLTLSAFHSIIFDAAVTATGNGKMTLTTNNNLGGASSGGAITFKSSGNVQLQGSSSALTINGQSYTLIHNVSQLLNINGNLSGRYALAQPIDLGGTTYGDSLIANGVSGGIYFLGVFDGLNNTISNLQINVSNASASVVGLFGIIGDETYNSAGTVVNLGLVGGSVIAGINSNVAFGPLAGEATGTVSNVYSSVNVIYNNVSGQVGGLVGYNWGVISNSYASGSVTATGPQNWAGGLVGFNEGNLTQPALITNSYATGAISGGSGSGGLGQGNGAGSDTGGLIGINRGTVTNVYSTGAVSGGAGTYIGGLIGENYTSGSPAIVTNGYWDSTTSGISTVNQGAGTPRTTAQLQNGTLPSGFPSSVWSTSAGAYPLLLQSPQLTPLTYTVASATSTYGTLATLGSVTLAGSPANVSGTVSLYTTNNSGTLSGLVTLSSTLNAGTYYQGVSALTGSAASNYTIATSGNTIGTLTISPLSVTLTGSQAYNGSTTISGSSLAVSNLVSGDSVTVGGSITNGVASPNANVTAQNLSLLSGLTLSNGNYTLSGGSGSVTITPAPLAVTGSKTYDGSKNFATSQLAVAGGAASGETITLSAGSGVAGSANVGTASGNLSGLAINVSGGQGLASNYSLPGIGALTISTAALTITPLAQSATYGTAYTLQNGLGVGYSQTGLVGGETISGVTLTAGGTGSSTGTTATTNVGNSYTITASAATGATLSNYSISYGAPATLTVNPATVYVNYSVANANSIFGTLATLGAVTLTGVSPSDSANVNPTLGVFSGSTPVTLTNITPAGTYSQEVTGLTGSAASNYTISSTGNTPGTLTISKLALTGTISAGSSVYGSTLAPGSVSFTNLVSGASNVTGTVSVNTAGNTSTSGKLKVGSYTGIESVSAINGADAGNYSFAGLTGDYTVSSLALTGTLSAGSSVYGSALTPGNVNFTNLVSGDVVTPGAVSIATTGNTSSSGNLKKGSYTGIESVSSIGGTDAGNYSFAGLTGDYTVSSLALTGTLSAGSSAYGSALTPGSVSFTNLVSGDVVTPGTVSVNTTGNTSSSGNLKKGSYTGIQSVSSISGTDAGNYSFAGLTGNYTVSSLALTGVLSAGSSVYGSALAPGSVSFTNLVSGDVVTPGGVSVTTTGNTSSSGNLKVGSYIGIESVSSIGGTDAGNYSFAGLTGNYAVGSLALTGTLSAGSSVYGSSLTPGSVSFTNLVSGDVVTPGAVSVTTTGNTSSSGNLKAGSYNGIESVSSISGTDAGNYSFAGLTGNYTVSSLALTGTLSAGSSVYGSALTPGSVSFANLVSGDVVTPGTVSVTTTGNSSSSGNLKKGSYTGIQSVSSISGTDAGNYSFAGLTGNYMVSSLALTGALSAGSSVYGSALAPGSVTFTNLVSGDVVMPGTVSVTTTGNTSSSGNLKVGSYTGIETVSAINGTDSGNYSFAGLTGDYIVGSLALTGTLPAGSSVYGSAPTPGSVTFTNVLAGDIVTPGAVSVTTTGNTSSSGNLKAGSYADIESVSVIGGTDAGNYSFAGLTGDYTVSSLALTGTLSAGSSVYGSALAPGSVSFTNLVAGDVVTPGTVSVTTAGNTSNSGNLKVGSYTGIQTVSSISGTDAGNYSFAGLSGNYSVGSLALTGALSAGSSVYGSALAPGSVSFTNLVSGDEVTPGAVNVNTTGNISTSGNLKAGSYIGIESVSSIGGADAGNYSFAGLTGNYTVNSLALTGSLSAGSSVYGSALEPGSVSFTNLIAGDVVTPGTVSVTTTGNTSSSGNLKAGSYTGIESVSSISGADAGNYSFTGLTGNYRVNSLALTGTLSAGSSVYGSALAPGSVSFTNLVAGDVVTPGTVSVTTTGNTSSSGNLKAGSYTGIESVSAINGTDAGNYSFAGLTGNYTVNRAVLNIAAVNGQSIVYGSAIPILSYTQSGLVSGDTISGALTITASLGSNTGNYAINQGTVTAGNDYTIIYRGGSFAITPAILTYVANPVERFSNADNPVLTGRVTGFVLNDGLANATTGSLTFATTATPTSAPGLYPILGAGLTANNGNYLFVQAAANLTALAINPAATTQGSQSIGSNTQVNIGQSSLNDIKASAFNNDVNPTQIIDKTGIGNALTSSDSDQPEKKDNDGVCVSYALGKPVVCLTQ